MAALTKIHVPDELAPALEPLDASLAATSYEIQSMLRDVVQNIAEELHEISGSSADLSGEKLCSLAQRLGGIGSAVTAMAVS
jgi:hypothetical protein